MGCNFNQEVNSAQCNLELCEEGMLLDWRTVFSPCVSAADENVGDRNQTSHVSSACPGSSFGCRPNWQPLALSSSCLLVVGKSASYIYMVAERSGCGR